MKKSSSCILCIELIADSRSLTFSNSLFLFGLS
jgi:hypothetical protein